jgi:hypothetical protein
MVELTVILCPVGMTNNVMKTNTAANHAEEDH